MDAIGSGYTMWLFEPTQYGRELTAAPCREKTRRRLFGKRWRCFRRAHSGITHIASLSGAAVLAWHGPASRPPVAVKRRAR